MCCSVVQFYFSFLSVLNIQFLPPLGWNSSTLHYTALPCLFRNNLNVFFVTTKIGKVRPKFYSFFPLCFEHPIRCHLSVLTVELHASFPFCVGTILLYFLHQYVLENMPLQLLAQVVSTPAVSLHCNINEKCT
jgi:hypothetical protein